MSRQLCFVGKLRFPNLACPFLVRSTMIQPNLIRRAYSDCIQTQLFTPVLSSLNTTIGALDLIPGSCSRHDADPIPLVSGAFVLLAPPEVASVIRLRRWRRQWAIFSSNLGSSGTDPEPGFAGCALCLITIPGCGDCQASEKTMYAG